MKRITISLIALYLSVIVVYGQSLVISHPQSGNTLNNGDTITATVTELDKSFVVRLDVTNTSSSSLDVKVKKIEMFTIPGSENFLCWDLCYPPNVFTSSNFLSINSNEKNTNFYGEYESNGEAGKSRIMYVFFDVNNPSDSSWAVVEYHTGSSVAYSNINKEETKVNAFPNPTNGIINFEYDLESDFESANILISNVLGEMIEEKQILNTEGKLVLDLSNYESGIYFYTIIVDNKAIISRKIVLNN